jgi:hypothetical protein
VRKRKLLGLDSETEDEYNKVVHTATYANEEDHPFKSKDPRNLYV